MEEVLIYHSELSSHELYNTNCLLLLELLWVGFLDLIQWR